MASQRLTDPLSLCLDLQGFEVLYVNLEEVPGEHGVRRRRKVIGLGDRRGFHQCSQCGKRHREGFSQEIDARRWRERSVGDLETFIEITPWRVECCGGTHVERFPWAAEGHRMTLRFFDVVAALCTKLAISVVAEWVNLSWDTVARVDGKAIRFALGGASPSLDGLKWIGIDEVSRTGGHQYFTMVTDLKSGRVVWIGDGKREATLARFFEILGKKRRRRIELVVSDLGSGYLGPIEKYVPQARHILDRFHIVQWVNEALSQLRRRVFGGGPRDAVGRNFKAKKWMLLKAREDLGQGDKLKLARLMKLNRPLYRAYLLKEQLREILHHPWKYLGALEKNLAAWCNAVMRSRIPEMKRVAKRLRPHFAKVLAAFEVDVRLGLVEAINGVVALLRRQAHGYRDVEYFKLKIYQRCSLDSNPWAEIVL